MEVPTVQCLEHRCGILNSTRRQTGSQCSSRRTGAICSHRLVQVTSLAAAFWMDASRCSRCDPSADVVTEWGCCDLCYSCSVPSICWELSGDGWRTHTTASLLGGIDRSKVPILVNKQWNDSIHTSSLMFNTKYDKFKFYFQYTCATKKNKYASTCTQQNRVVLTNPSWNIGTPVWYTQVSRSLCSSSYTYTERKLVS